MTRHRQSLRGHPALLRLEGTEGAATARCARGRQAARTCGADGACSVRQRPAGPVCAEPPRWAPRRRPSRCLGGGCGVPFGFAFLPDAAPLSTSFLPRGLGWRPSDGRTRPPARSRRGACAWGLADALRPHCALSVLLVQLCEAAPRSCVSQLIRLQCKLSVSGCDTLRGFMTRAPSTPAASPQVICFRGQCRASRLRGDGGRASRRPRSCSRASNSELSPPPHSSLRVSVLLSAVCPCAIALVSGVRPLLLR